MYLTMHRESRFPAAGTVQLLLLQRLHQAEKESQQAEANAAADGAVLSHIEPQAFLLLMHPHCFSGVCCFTLVLESTGLEPKQRQ